MAPRWEQGGWGEEKGGRKGGGKGGWHLETFIKGL